MNAENTNVIRILLADDHAVLRSGLRLLLEAQTEISVVGEAETGTQAISLTQELQPDIILLDLSMPGLGGLDALPVLRSSSPGTRVLILTMHDEPQYLRQAIKSGAAGYVLKKAADVELLSAIRATMRGEVYVHPSMTRPLLDDLMPERDDSESKGLWERLSQREQEVLRLVALGYTSTEIADKLCLSSKTVDTYRARGMEKLGLRSRASLVRFALQHELISAD